MTTDSDRISRLEGIIEQIAATLTALHQGQEALRSEMRERDAALRAEMSGGDAALRAEMSGGDAALRAEMREGDAALRAEMHSQFRMVLLINAGHLGNRHCRNSSRSRGSHPASLTTSATLTAPTASVTLATSPHPRHSRGGGNPESIVWLGAVEVVDPRRVASLRCHGLVGASSGLWITAAACMTGDNRKALPARPAWLTPPE